VRLHGERIAAPLLQRCVVPLNRALHGPCGGNPRVLLTPARRCLPDDAGGCVAMCLELPAPSLCPRPLAATLRLSPVAVVS
jgi:hypothetical protein